MTRRRTTTVRGLGARIVGDRQLTGPLALRFEVVRGVLLGTVGLDDGARVLQIPIAELARLVAGARERVIRTLGRGALDAARGVPMPIAV